MPLYGTIHDSPVITVIQKTARRGKRGVRAEEDAERLTTLFAPFLNKLQDALEQAEESKKKK